MTQFKLTGFRELPKKYLKKWYYICSLKLKKELEMRSTFKILFYANKGKRRTKTKRLRGTEKTKYENWIPMQKKSSNGQATVRHV